ncbi:hypothetical protein F5141DRAFT_215643 [Pisolithus sp. B1]|nr:hypothetical protein F5141DRAFT_215643 [Pisolithus sp. B1]
MSFLLTPLLATSTCAVLIVACLSKLSRYPNLDHISIAGHSSLLASYLFTKGLEVDLARLVQEGYDGDKSAVFRVANLTHWVVCFPRSDLERVARVSEDHLSFGHATGNFFRTEYTFGMKMNDFHHLSLSRSYLTRYLSVLYADVRDEIVVACNELLDPKHNEWRATSAVHVALTVVSRTSNRIIVGPPLCRDPDWLNTNLPQAIVDKARTLRFYGTAGCEVCHQSLWTDQPGSHFT